MERKTPHRKKSSDFVLFLKEMKVMFGGLIVALVSIYGKQFFDLLIKERENIFKGRNLPKLFQDNKQILDDPNSTEEQKNLARKRMEEINNDYWKLTQRYLIDIKSKDINKLLNKKKRFSITEKDIKNTYAKDYLETILLVLQRLNRREITVEELHDLINSDSTSKSAFGSRKRRSRSRKKISRKRISRKRISRKRN